MKVNTILALDCATKTGYCLLRDGKVVLSGTQDFSKKRGESNGTMFLRFRSWLSKVIRDNNVDFVVYEQSHHRGGAATDIGVNLTGRVQEVAAENNIEFMPAHTAILKKFATGSGKASKKDMIDAARNVLGRDPVDDNEADAVMLALFGQNKIS